MTPQDVKSVGADVLRHRIIVSYEAEAEDVTSETIIERDLCRAAGALTTRCLSVTETPKGHPAENSPRRAENAAAWSPTTFAGQYRSVFKGRGMNFEEVREYAPGDEVRTIDWNVTARFGEMHGNAFVKKFTEERELTVLLVVDVSASGKFGGIELSKRELAAEVASVLAFSATKNNDKVGLLLFSDHVELFIPPKKGRPHTLRLIREILFFDPKGRGTKPGPALDYLNRVVTRRAVVFLISDFQAEHVRQGTVGDIAAA